MPAIRRAAPNEVILDIGSNDLCEDSLDPDTIALAIVAFLQILIIILIMDLKLQRICVPCTT